jgi:hypothetical protein
MAVPKDQQRKVERAFEVVERLERREKTPKPPEASPKGKKEKGLNSGLRVHFSLDALISEKDTRGAKEGEIHPGKSNLLNIRFTVPYLWQIPVLGKTALKVIKRFQSDDYPESIRDILDSFRRKKPM